MIAGVLEFEAVQVVEVDPAAARVYAEGWQSWSPARTLGFGQAQPRPADAQALALGYRADQPTAAGTIQGEGLLAVSPAPDEPTVVFSEMGVIPSIRAVPVGRDRLRIEATGPVAVQLLPEPLPNALSSWADGHRVAALRPAPTVWCSWYHYFTGVAEGDIVENLNAIAELDLPVDVVQVDDGYAREIGDWLTPSQRFPDLPVLAARIRAHGRRSGIWVAPFLVGARSEIARRHPDWLVRDAWAGRNWDQDLHVLDVTHPGAARHLSEVFATLAGYGFDYFKIDFCYAGALGGGRYAEHAGPAAEIGAYREGLGLIREAIGAQAFLVGCGAPILASVGLVDAMRISPDTATYRDGGDASAPGQDAAIANGRERAWQHGRFWVNDPDCLIARPEVTDRERWAQHIRRFGGLRASSDRLRELDDWGLQVTRELLAGVPAPTPF